MTPALLAAVVKGRKLGVDVLAPVKGATPMIIMSPTEHPPGGFIYRETDPTARRERKKR
jgi:hypothetical protein